MVSRRSRTVVVLGIFAVATVGCTVPGEDSATRIPPDEVPFQLLDQTTTTTTIVDASTTSAPDDSVVVYFVREGRLANVTRDSTAADPASVLARLVEGPSEAESEAGLRSALVPELAQIVDIVGDVVTIDLNEEFSSLAPTEQRLALAQITFSLSQLPAIGEIRFLVAGQAASVPRGDGSSTDRPVTPSDYGELAPA